MDSEPIEQDAEWPIRTGDASDSKLAFRFLVEREDDVEALQLSKLFQNGSRTVADPCPFHPLFEGLPENIGEEADEDVGANTLFLVVPNRADRKVALLDSKCGFSFRELDVRFPKVVVVPIVHICPKDVTTLAGTGPFVPFGLNAYVEPKTGSKRSVVDELDAIAAGRSRILLEKAADLSIDGTLLHPGTALTDARAEASEPFLDPCGKPRVQKSL